MTRHYGPKVAGALVRTIRRRNRMTQGKFAERLGVTRRTVIRWELGEVRFGRYEPKSAAAFAALEKLNKELAKGLRVALPTL